MTTSAGTEAPPGQPTSVVLRRVRLPLVAPLRSAHGIEVTRELIVVQVTLANGATGWGECSALTRPTYTSEYTDGCWEVLGNLLAPALLDGRDGAAVGHPMASAALHTALLDARLHHRGIRLVDELAARFGRPARTVVATAVLGREDRVDRLLARVDQVMGQGAAAVKLKVSPHPTDLAAVRTVRATWPDLALAVDGNGTLDARTLSVLDPLGLVYIEQPAPADDLTTSAAVAARLDTPVALDESVTSVGTLKTAVALGAASVVNVKPARLGGIVEAAEVAWQARDAGWATFVGGMLESGVGRAAALGLAAIPLFDLPTDLGPSARYFARDVTEEIVTDQTGAVVVPTGPGIGVEVDLERLSDVTVQDHRLSR